MAAFSRRMLKLIVVAGSVPAVGIGIGYRMRSVQAAEGGISKGERRIYKACELPIYQVSSFDEEPSDLANRAPYPRNVVEEQIGVTRKTIQDFLSQFQDTFDTITRVAETGIEHSASSLDYIQNNPGELPRIVFIAVAGMGGIVLGYRGGVFRKLMYGSVAGVAAASLCYPKRTVELSREATQYLKDTYKDIVGENAPEKFWPFKDLQLEKSKDDKATQDKPAPKLQVNTTAASPPASSQKSDSVSADKKPQRIKGDPGQSNPGDKDLYSTRSS